MEESREAGELVESSEEGIVTGRSSAVNGPAWINKWMEALSFLSVSVYMAAKAINPGGSRRLLITMISVESFINLRSLTTRCTFHRWSTMSERSQFATVATTERSQVWLLLGTVF